MGTTIQKDLLQLLFIETLIDRGVSMLDMLKRLFLTNSSEPTGKQDLLQESQDSKRLIDRKLYSEVKPYIDYILEKVNKEIMERASNGYYDCVTGFHIFRYDDMAEIGIKMGLHTEIDKEINNLNYEHLKVIKELLLDKLSLFYPDKLKVKVWTSNDSLDNSTLVSVDWEQREPIDKPNTYDIVKQWFTQRQNVCHNKGSLKEIAYNAIRNRFPDILYRVNKDIQKYVADGKDYSITSFSVHEDYFYCIERRHYGELKKYLEANLSSIYKNKLEIDVFHSFFIGTNFVITVDWKKEQKKGLF